MHIIGLVIVPTGTGIQMNGCHPQTPVCPLFPVSRYQFPNAAPFSSQVQAHNLRQPHTFFPYMSTRAVCGMGMGCMSASHEAMDRGRQCVGEEPQGANASRVRKIAIKSPQVVG